jgi:putative ABC transport system substrate-binding protein
MSWSVSVDVIVAGGTNDARAASRTQRQFPSLWRALVSIQLRQAWVESLARPGGNVTGITNLSTELGGKRLELLKEAVPKVARVAVLYDPAARAVYAS